MPPAEPTTFLVEHYWPGITEEGFRDAAARVKGSVAGLEGVCFLHLTLVPEDEAAFCVVSAAAPALVEEAYRRAGVPFERILAALEVQ